MKIVVKGLFCLSCFFGPTLFSQHSQAIGGYNSDCDHGDKSLRCVEYKWNYDGDTVTVNIPDVHQLIGEHIMIRVAGIDAAEMKTNDSCEKRMAIRAQKEVERVLKRAKRIELRNVERGKYFRIVADVYVNGRSLARYLLKKKLAIEYDGGYKPDIDWCNWE